MKTRYKSCSIKFIKAPQSSHCDISCLVLQREPRLPPTADISQHDTFSCGTCTLVPITLPKSDGNVPAPIW